MPALEPFGEGPVLEASLGAFEPLASSKPAIRQQLTTSTAMKRLGAAKEAILETIRGPDHYYGDIVAQYEKRRKSRPQWAAEQQLVERFLSEIPQASHCLDVPVGTGRYLEFYVRYGHEVTCCDLSSDMLAEARRAAEKSGMTAAFARGSVFKLPFAYEQFDAIVCTRLLTWFSESQIDAALGELRRVSSGRMMVTANVWRTPKELFMRPRRLWSLLRVKSRQEAVNQRKGSKGFYKHEGTFFQDAFARHGLRVERETALVEERLFRYVAWWLRVV